MTPATFAPLAIVIAFGVVFCAVSWLASAIVDFLDEREGD